MAMTKCQICKVRKASVPDRDDWPRYRIRLCEDCYAERLGGDLKIIIEHEDRKRHRKA